MLTADIDIDSLTEKIIGSAIEVHREMGRGLLESVYRECLICELASRNIRAVELKAIESIHPVHLAQVISYLKLTGCPTGLLMNFNAPTLRSGLRRLDHPS